MHIPTALWFLIIIATPGVFAQSSIDQSTVSLQVLDGRPVVNGVYLNGSGPYKFLVDTGAQTNTVEGEIVRTLRLTPSFQVQVATAAGATSAFGTRGATLTLGTVKASGQELLFAPLDVVHTVARDIRGVLGQEFLANFDYLLDLKGHRLILNPLATLAGERIPFDLVLGRMVVTTNHGRLAIDSGTNALILFGDATDASRSGLEMRTSSGMLAVSSSQRRPVTVGNRRLGAQSVTVPRPSNLPEDGLLPVSLFRAIYVSNSGKYVILN